MVYQVAYISFLEVDDFASEVDRILSTARRRNAAENITGILIHVRGMFMQVLEGDAAAVKSTMSRIAADKRHSRITTVLEREVEERKFGGWNMGWCNAPDDHPAADELQRLGDPANHRSGPNATYTPLEDVLEAFFTLTRA
ncbi:MAG: BLUF domain-containing protein [Pseudomonadota bacterium]